MKRFSLARMARLCGFVLILCAALTASASAFNGLYVVDEAGVLSDAQAQALENQAASLAETYDFGVYIVVLDDFSEYGYDDPYYFGVALYEEWGYGLGDDHDGQMLFMSMDNRKYALVYHGYGDIAFTEGGRDSLESAMLERFRNNDWAGGFRQYMDWSERLLEAAANGEPVGWDDYGDYHPDDAAIAANAEPEDEGIGLFDILIVAVIPAVVAALVCLAFAGQLKSVREAAQAGEYAVPHSLNLKEKSDRYKYSTETRTKVESDHDSGGGGGSTHHSGGGYSGRSGSF